MAGFCLGMNRFRTSANNNETYRFDIYLDK